MTSPRPEESETRPWDQDKANWLIGKHVVVGITRLASDGRTVKAQSRYRGKVISADRVDGFEIECEGAWAGRIMTLPPDLGAFRLVDADENKLRSTGEAVKDPEIIANWTIVEPPSES
ncbi:MAG: hypothetical protein WAN31_00475 [Methylovirgula sp.]